VIYRARDKVMEYRFSEHKVRGRVEYASDVADPPGPSSRKPG